MRITELGDKIKTLRKNKHLQQKKLARELKVGQATISQWEHGRQEPNPTQRKKLCDYFHITESDLFGRLEIKKLNQEVVPITRVPVILWSLANCFIGNKEFFSNIGSDEWMYSTYEGGEFMFALKVKDNSMEPEFHKGDMIIVDTERHPQHNDYVIVRDTHSQEATFRQLKKYKTDVILHPLNPEFPDIELSASNKRYIVLGKIVVKNKFY